MDTYKEMFKEEKFQLKIGSEKEWVIPVEEGSKAPIAFLEVSPEAVQQPSFDPKQQKTVRLVEHKVNKVKSVYRHLLRGFVNGMLLDFWVWSNNRRRRRLYVADEGGKCIDHVLEELVAGKGAIEVRVPPVIKLSGRQERLLESKNREFIAVVGSTEMKASPVVINR